MKTTTVHLEDVTRAARQGVALAFAVSLLGLAALLAVGLPAPIGSAIAAGLLAVGTASGGFGLVARVALRRPALTRRSARRRGRALGSLRVPQLR